MTYTASTIAKFIFDNSLLLVGTAGAVVWANLDVASYETFANPLHFAVNDIGMVFFFALAAKEVFEATLPGGALASPPGVALAETKMGALLSFVAAPLALVVSRVARGRQPWSQAANRDGL